MIILRNKLFAQRKYGLVIPRTPNTYHHYTTPQSAIGIDKSGLKFRNTKKGLSAYRSTEDILVGKNFDALNTYAQGKQQKFRGEAVDTKTGKIIKSFNFGLANIKRALDSGRDLPENTAEEHLNRHGVTSWLFYPSQYKGMMANPNNAVQKYSNIDGLHWGKSGYDLTTNTVGFRKTRNPIRVVINGKGIKASKGTDTGEVVLNHEGGIIPRSKMKYEIPKSGVGTRDTDIKHLRRYLKGHKGQVNATRETMEALYGSKWPHLDKFKSETEI